MMCFRWCAGPEDVEFSGMWKCLWMFDAGAASHDF